MTRTKVHDLRNHHWWLLVKGENMKIVFAALGVAAIVAALTPNTSDNKAVDFILNIVNALGGNVGKAKNG